MQYGRGFTALPGLTLSDRYRLIGNAFHFGVLRHLLLAYFWQQTLRAAQGSAQGGWPFVLSQQPQVQTARSLSLTEQALGGSRSNCEAKDGPGSPPASQHSGPCEWMGDPSTWPVFHVFGQNAEAGAESASGPSLNYDSSLGWAQDLPHNGGWAEVNISEAAEEAASSSTSADTDPETDE